MKKNETYEQFVEKFKSKLTTDDCYTPPVVYDTIRQYVNDHVCPLGGHRIVRPFYPGGDYERFDYQPGDIVLDNPPFSILARIVDFYLDRHVPFFLFAPALTLFGYGSRPGITCVCANCEITYDNGAVVRTSFLSNLYPSAPAFIIDGRLFKAVHEAQDRAKPGRSLPRLQYPPCVATAAILGKVATRGIYLECPRSEAAFIRKLDAGKQLFGGGFIISERMAAERMAAERMAAREVQTFTLSPKEQQLQQSLNP